MGCAGSQPQKVESVDDDIASFALASENPNQARRNACTKLDGLPPPDQENPDDAAHARMYIFEYSADTWDMGEAPKGADRTKALRWLRGALLKQSEHGPKTKLGKGYKDITYWLLANSRMWPDWENGEEAGFKMMRQLATDQLDKLAEDTERDVYRGMNLAEQLGSLGAGLTVHPRQDVHAGFNWPKGYEGLTQDFPDFVCFLRIAAVALDAGFQEKAAAAFESAIGERPANASPPVKGFMRMNAKLLSDHKNEPEPKPAENVDCNRTAWVISADKLPAAYAEAERLLGTPLRVKNNYASDADISGTRGYRSLLANYLYDTGKTWGELTAEVQAATEVVKTDRINTATRATGLSTDAANWMADRTDETATAFATPAMMATPAKLVCEIQFMTPEYYQMRIKTNAWYKINRAQNAYGMKQDYIGGLNDD